jgi:hypothetical protein
MNRKKSSPLVFIKVVLFGILYFSGLALVYHLRWFLPFLEDNTNFVSQDENISVVWYVVQICSNIIFIVVSLTLLRLFKKYQKTGFFDIETLKVFDTIILSCLMLTLLSSVLTVYNNFTEVHLEDWTTPSGVINLLFRSFTRLLVFKEPQTMYLLLAIILWAVKQFVTKALVLKSENEAFV